MQLTSKLQTDMHELLTIYADLGTVRAERRKTQHEDPHISSDGTKARPCPSLLGRLDWLVRTSTKGMATLVTMTDHQPSLSRAGLEDKPAGTRRQQLASKPVELVRLGESATARAIKLASDAAIVTVGKTKVALVPPSAAIPPQTDSTMPRNGFQRAVTGTPGTATQPIREPPATNAAIVSVGKTKVALVPPSAAAAAAAMQSAAAAQATETHPQATRLPKARPPSARKTRLAKPATTADAHQNLLDAMGPPVTTAPRLAAAQSAGVLAGGPCAGASEVDDGMTEEWFESVAETPTPYSLNLQQHRKLQKLFIEHVARMWFHKRTEESDARLRVIIASARCHDMVPEVLARLRIPFLVQVLYQHPNQYVSTQAKLLNESDDWKKALALMRKIAMKQLGLTKEQADKIVANMVKNYSLPTKAAAAAAASSKAPTTAQAQEGGNAGEPDQGGNADRRGKRGRRSNLQSSPSPVKRPRDAVAPGEGIGRDRAMQPELKKLRTVKEVERSQLPAILELQAAESPRQCDAAVERLLPKRMMQAEHASYVAQPSEYQATPGVPASIAPGAQPQKRRPGRPPKKVKAAAQDLLGNQAEATKRLAPVGGDGLSPSMAQQDTALLPQRPPSGAAPAAQANAPGRQNQRKRARRLVPASAVDAMLGAPLNQRQPRDAAQASGRNATGLLGLAGGSLPARPSSTSAKSGSGGAAGVSSRSSPPVPALIAEELPSASLAADLPAGSVPAREALDPLSSAAEDAPDAGVTPVQPTMSPDALDQVPTSAAEERPCVAVTVDSAPELSPGLDAVAAQDASACSGLVPAAEEPRAALGADQLAVPLPGPAAVAEQLMDISPLPQPPSAVCSPQGSAEQPSWAGSPASGGCSQLLHETTEPTGISDGSSPDAHAPTLSPLLLPLPPPNPSDGKAPAGMGGRSQVLRPATVVQPEQLSVPSCSRTSDSSPGASPAPGLPIRTSQSTPFGSCGSAGAQPAAPALPAPGTPLSRRGLSAAAPSMASIPMADLLPRPAAGPAQQHSSVEQGGSASVQQQQEEAGGVREEVSPRQAPSGGLLTELFMPQSWWRADGTFKLKTSRGREKQAEDMHSDTEDPACRTSSEQPESPMLAQPQTELGHEAQLLSFQPQPLQRGAPQGASPLRPCSLERAASEPPSCEAAERKAPTLVVRRSHSLPNGMRLPAPGRALYLSTGRVQGV
ncbi:hypothetical protein COCOBI_18-1780 [Coccomyxa sp. Obi]|nr:hypothetical protein COCOBI_18-1780 [Coccomyxa sp. Obi]